MKHLSNLFLLLLLVPLVQSEAYDRCGWWTKTKLFFKCRSAAKKLDEFQERFRESKDWGSMAEHLKSWIDCLAPFPCTEEERRSMMNLFERAKYNENDNQLCLKGFFKKAYQGQFSKEESCYREYSFLDKDANRRRDAFTNGKLCFIKYLREHCTSSIVEYYSFQTYQKFIKSMSTFSHNCDSIENDLNSLRCNAIVAEYNSRVDPLNNMQEKRGNPFVADSLKTCRDVQSCKTNSCFSRDSYDRQEVTRNCDGIEREFLG
ncbi:unnamed protein product [Caenorhabditis brenneri]